MVLNDLSYVILYRLRNTSNDTHSVHTNPLQVSLIYKRKCYSLLSIYPIQWTSINVT